MSKCTVYTIDKSSSFEGEYTFDDNQLEITIYNYSSNSFLSNNSTVEYKEFIIEDLKNKVFMYSPVFYNNGTTFDLTYYETFRTNFYFKTESYQNSDEFIADMSIRAIRFFHPLLIHNFTNPCLQIDKNENIINCNLNTQSETKTITIQNNNVESLVLGGVYNYSVKNYRQSLSIETENYVEIVLSDPISYDDLLSYVNEFDVFISIYSPTKLRTYATQIRSDSGKLLTVVHKLLGKEKHYNKPVHQPVKLGFFEYIEKAYKTFEYRLAEDKNKYLPLEFKKPTSLEDQYTYYFRYIDMYMGERLKSSTQTAVNNYDRLSTFVDENLSFFDSQDISNIDDFKNELNSLRNHYVHEGYYLPNNQFKVTKKKKFKYYKTMDYNWLYRITQALKLGVYKILYEDVLKLDIDINELKYSLKY